MAQSKDQSEHRQYDRLAGFSPSIWSSLSTSQQEGFYKSRWDSLTNEQKKNFNAKYRQHRVSLPGRIEKSLAARDEAPVYCNPNQASIEGTNVSQGIPPQPSWWNRAYKTAAKAAASVVLMAAAYIGVSALSNPTVADAYDAKTRAVRAFAPPVAKKSIDEVVEVKIADGKTHTAPVQEAEPTKERFTLKNGDFEYEVSKEDYNRAKDLDRRAAISKRHGGAFAHSEKEMNAMKDRESLSVQRGFPATEFIEDNVDGVSYFVQKPRTPEAERKNETKDISTPTSSNPVYQKVPETKMSPVYQKVPVPETKMTPIEEVLEPQGDTIAKPAYQGNAPKEEKSAVQKSDIDKASLDAKIRKAYENHIANEKRFSTHDAEVKKQIDGMAAQSKAHSEAKKPVMRGRSYEAERAKVYQPAPTPAGVDTSYHGGNARSQNSSAAGSDYVASTIQQQFEALLASRQLTRSTARALYSAAGDDLGSRLKLLKEIVDGMRDRVVGNLERAKQPYEQRRNSRAKGDKFTNYGEAYKNVRDLEKKEQELINSGYRIENEVLRSEVSSLNQWYGESRTGILDATKHIVKEAVETQPRWWRTKARTFGENNYLTQKDKEEVARYRAEECVPGSRTGNLGAAVWDAVTYLVEGNPATPLYDDGHMFNVRPGVNVPAWLLGSAWKAEILFGKGGGNSGEESATGGGGTQGPPQVGGVQVNPVGGGPL